MLSAIPELTGLTPEDINILDAVIERAAPSATTFLSVFKAHNDVLQERGLDPHEVVYYGKLLKLGTLKGKNWEEKWKMVKLQHGYMSNCEDQRFRPPKTISSSTQVSTTQGFRRIPHIFDNDSLTLHSHRDDSEFGLSDVADIPATARRAIAQARERRGGIARERRGSIANEDEAWHKIQMVRDEQAADRFREDILVERCWDIWKRGFQWIHVSTLLLVLQASGSY